MTAPDDRSAASLAGSVTTAAGGLARALSRFIGSAVLDVSSGIARVGEAVHAVGTGRELSPATLRVRVAILRDEAGAPLTTAAAVEPALATAARVLQDGAGVRVRVLGVQVLDRPGTPAQLDTSAHQALLWDDIRGRTSLFREIAEQGSDLVAVGVPVTVVVVRSIAGRVTGCSLGINADWVVAEASLFDRARPDKYDETVLVHELGHALNLPHLRDPANLMHPESSPPGTIRGTALRRWQAAIIQANRHVIPGVSE